MTKSHEAIARTPMKHSEQLDGYRGIAVIFVVTAHYGRFLKDTLIDNLDLGRLGVVGFFVLSGFLITQILLGYRNLIDSNELTANRALKIFLLRRSLRIFPLYFGSLLFFGYVLGNTNIQESMLWHVSYTSNFGQALGYNFNNANHFWSLCVEEQFYILWPLLILFTPDHIIHKRLRAVLGLSLCAGLLLVMYSPTVKFSALLPFGGPFFALTLGGLLAFRFTKNEYSHENRKMHGGILYGAAIPAMFFVTLFGDYIIGQLEVFLRDIAFAVICYEIISKILADSYQSLAFTPLRWIGKISYGIYVYHLLITVLFPQIFSRIGLSRTSAPLLTFVLEFLIVVAIAAVSYYLFEQHFLRLKDRFSPRLLAKQSLQK